MKNITLHKILMWFVLFFVGNSLFAQQAVDLTLKFNATTSEYEVYARPTQNGTFSMGGGSQVSIITPASYPNTKLTVTSVEGGPWDDNSRLYDPIPASAIDFHSISTNGTYPPFTFVANTEKLLFKFTATGGCVPGMRIYRNLAEGALPRDPDSNVSGMQGNDFENYLGQPSTGGNQEYNANYANTGVTCAAAPAPDLVTTIGQPSPSLVAGLPSTVPVTVTNIGTAPTTGVITTTITLPAGTSAPAGPFVTNGNTCTTSGQTVTCTNPGPLSITAPTNATVIEIPVTAAPITVGTTPGPFTATPSTPGETTTGNNPAPPMTPTAPVVAAPAPDLVTTIGQPSPSLVAGLPSTVPVTVTNIGTAPTTGVITTTITLPAGTSAPAGPFVTNGNTCTTSGQTVTCTNPGPLSITAPTNATVIEIPVTAAPITVGTTPGPFTATPSTPGETTTGNNPAPPMTPTAPVVAAPAPDLVTTIGQPTTPFVVGFPSNVPVTVTNIGTAPTTGVITTTITLPAGTSAPAGPFVTNGNTCTTSGQTVTCTNPGPLSNVTPNNSTVMNIPVTATPSIVGTNPGPFTATPSTPGETTTTNNPATPMTPTTSVVAAPIVNVKVNVKLFLQGAYDNATGLMRDDLRSRGFLPTAQPYSAMTRTSYHIGTEATTAAALAATGSNAIVDWVLLELRTGTTAATRVATRAALVQRDGDVVDIDGISPVTFNNKAAGAYYIVATHRNHLGVMSEVAVSMSATATTCDFTGAYDGFGTYAQKSIGNLNALWAGNVTHTGLTHRSLIFSGANSDSDGVKNDVLTAPLNTAFNNSYVPTGYKLGDTNLDGDVKYQGPANDVDNFIFLNVLPFTLNTTNSALYIMSEQH